MTLHKCYWIACSNENALPERDVIFRSVLRDKRSELQISYISNDVDLNKATMLDFKVDKWAIDPRWRDLQEDEPFIRIEFLRGEQRRSFFEKNKGIIDSQVLAAGDNYIVTMELDDGNINEIDIAILTCLAGWFAGHCGEWVIQDKRRVIDVDTLRLEANKASDVLSGLRAL